MIEILLFLLAGILAGYLIRHKHRLLNILQRMIIWSIFLLLFSLGITVGNDPMIISSLPHLGLTAFFLTLAGVAGSLIVAFALWKFTRIKH